MNTWTSEEVASQLGTSRKRVTRAAHNLGLTAGNQTATRVRYTEQMVHKLATKLGTTPTIVGLSRTETIVLAELARRPQGLISARAVARACTISPASASKAVTNLTNKGLVTQTRTVVALGHAREVTVLRANVAHPRWTQLLTELSTVRVPEQAPVAPAATHLPTHLRHAFWNVDDTTFAALNTRTHGVYIADRALTTRDLNLLAFSATHLNADAWNGAAKARGRTPQDKRFAENLARNTR